MILILNSNAFEIQNPLMMICWGEVVTSLMQQANENKIILIYIIVIYIWFISRESDTLLRLRLLDFPIIKIIIIYCYIYIFLFVKYRMHLNLYPLMMIGWGVAVTSLTKRDNLYEGSNISFIYLTWIGHSAALALTLTVTLTLKLTFWTYN
jgi:hypothetical protein